MVHNPSVKLAILFIPEKNIFHFGCNIFIVYMET